MATCYRHPSRETGVSCSSCGRPICPDCMTTTPVGMRCPECSRQRTVVRTLRSTVRRPEVTIALIAIMQSGVGGLILINLVISFTLPGISWGGHVGGLIGGALAALAIQAGSRYRAQALALLACLALAVVSFAGSVAVASSTKTESV